MRSVLLNVHLLDCVCESRKMCNEIIVFMSNKNLYVDYGEYFFKKNLVLWRKENKKYSIHRWQFLISVYISIYNYFKCFDDIIPNKARDIDLYGTQCWFDEWNVRTFHLHELTLIIPFVSRTRSYTTGTGIMKFATGRQSLKIVSRGKYEKIKTT